MGWSRAHNLLATQKAQFVQPPGVSGENCWNGHFPDLPFLRAAICRRMREGLCRMKMPCTPTFTSILLCRRPQATLNLLMNFSTSPICLASLCHRRSCLRFKMSISAPPYIHPATSQVREPHCTQVNLGVLEHVHFIGKNMTTR